MEKDETIDTKPVKDPTGISRYFKWAGYAFLVLAVLAGSYASYIYSVSPEVIRQPLLEHYHFRMQVVADGKQVDFSREKFQRSYAKDASCSALLPGEPIHFHDNKDQLVHIHWEGMTGGLVLKNYGWNFIGGQDGALGYRFDDMPGLKKVPIHSRSLPGVPEGANFYVYTGDQNGYTKRDFEDYKRQDLEKFFGKTSNFPAHKENQKKRPSLSALLFPNAAAHAGEDHSAAPGTTEEEELKKINNLLGNVVIFAQDKEPSDAQIKARFNDLEPLSDSSCGG